ncbi:MAG: prepilin-type N-terminal cleavage/methylation domain-containing protein [Nitrospirota bacterium]|nr:prepilin-type N-terminal cleavage/methylation domain-containing protein [Nitrospirota bacterium]MDP2382860.1 prepilin-type N-terminal cleavage/methylation domain-containing protein [Nitrospirota bacterium]MDP3597666.1 prepilin-type N-terminal cleavage/methylation domain-containing protein [Nitrospirota bacterium]
MNLSRHPRMWSCGGFTLIELMIVVAILGILVSLATVSYSHFMTKAKSVEGEIVVREIERLEYLYHASNHGYTNNLTDLGFAMTGALKYYTPEVRQGADTDKISYQVRALPVAASATDSWLLTSYRDGAVQVDRVPVSEIGMFATVRYLGNAGTISSGEASNASVGGGASGNNEPEWSGGGRSLGCQECGRVVINQRN